MNSLKQFVEDLDQGTMSRFVAQVSEARDQRVSRAYAVSLYEEVARVHGKLIIPHIPRVMATVTRSLSSSGGSPQLHQACAKVVSAVARHLVEEGSPAEADETLRDLCLPLLSVLARKLEPLAAGAAICLQALVESEKWKYASDEIVKEVCLKISVALGEMLTRTVAHMQLARSLVTTHPSFFNNRYGVALLRTGSEVLRQTSASGTWQQKVSAARLMHAVLPIVDEATLASELEHVIHALGNCKHDRMAHVRLAVREALKTAKALAAYHTRVSIDVGKQGSLRPTTPEFRIPHPPQLGEEMGSEQQSSHIVSSFFVPSKFGRIRAHSFLDNAATTACVKQEGMDILVEEVSSHGNTVDMESKQGLPSEESTYNQVGGRQDTNFSLLSSSRSLRRQTSLTEPSRKSVCELEGSPSDSRNQSVGPPSHNNVNDYLHGCSGVLVGHGSRATLEFLSERQASHSSLLHWRSLADISRHQNRRVLIIAEDFVPFSTPRRLVHALQSSIASPLGFRPSKDKAAESLHEGDVPESATSSEAGWSVRDNPIVSDISLKTVSDADDGKEQRNICTEMVRNSRTESSSKESATEIVHTANCEKLSSQVALASESLSCIGTSIFLEHKCSTDNAEVLNDRKAQEFCLSLVQRQGRLLSVVGERCPGQCNISGEASEETRKFQGEDDLTMDGQYTAAVLTSERKSLLLKRFQHYFRDIPGKF